MAHGTSTQIPG